MVMGYLPPVTKFPPWMQVTLGRLCINNTKPGDTYESWVTGDKYATMTLRIPVWLGFLIGDVQMWWRSR